MAESSDIDAALVAKLLADTALRALMPDGVFFDVAGTSLATAGATSKRYVLVSLVDADDEAIFEGRAAEDALYAVEARALSTTVTAAQMTAAAARIEAVLHLGTLTVAGYTLQVMRRRRRTRMADRDAADPSILWYYRGGHYQVKVAPDEPA
jgi:hypothetical protein